MLAAPEPPGPYNTAGGSGTDQAMLLAKELGAPIIVAGQLCADPAVPVHEVSYQGVKLYYPTVTLEAAIRHLAPDSVIIHYLPLNDTPLLVKLKERAKTILVMHENLYDLMITDGKRFALPYLINMAQNCSIVVALSDAQKEVLRCITMGNIEVIPPAIDYTALRKITTNPAMEDFATAGRLVPIKNHLTALLAMKLLVKDYPQAFLRIYEDGDLKQAYEQLVQAMGISASVGFFGRLPHDQFIGDLCQCKALATTSLNENNSIVELECGALGIPVLRAYGVSPNYTVSPAPYAAAMAELLQQYEVKKAHAEAQRDLYAQHDVAVVAEAYRKLLEA